jgi:nitrite reductase (NO-forming)
MAIETKPKRQRITSPEVEEGRLTEPVPTDGRPVGPGATGRPPAAPPQPVGPSWREFLFTQFGLVLGLALLFGAIAYSLIARAQPGGQAAGAAASGPANPQVVDYAHSNSGAPAPAAGAVARLPAPQIAPPVGQRGRATVKVNLETQEIVATLDDGVTYEYWTFNGTVPGPMIRVRQGDTVELTLSNATTSKVLHNIDLHAATGPGGGAEVTMVGPGESKAFSFKALNPGVYVYHCAAPPVPHHISSGMYGLIVVEPPQGLPAVDREYYVMQGDFYLQGNRGDKGLRAFSNEKMVDERADYVVFNGAVGALTGDGALKARVGETVRIFFGVGGPNITSSFHVIGEIFDRVATEGGALEDPSRWATNVQSTGVPAGGAAIVEFKVDVPGKYVLVDHSLGRSAKGAVGNLVVEGPENPEIFAPSR